MDSKIGKLALSLFAASAVSFQANAAVISYSDQASFLSATGTLSFEGFESAPVNNSLNQSTLSFTGFDVSASNSRLGIYDHSIASAEASEGTQFLEHQSGAGVTTTFTFNSAIDAFGFNLLDYGDWGSGQLTLVNDTGDSVLVALGGAANGVNQYFGITSDTLFTSAVFTNTIQGEAFGFDEVSYGATTVNVPEPGSLALFGLGLAGIGVIRRKTKNA